MGGYNRNRLHICMKRSNKICDPGSWFHVLLDAIYGTLTSLVYSVVLLKLWSITPGLIPASLTSNFHFPRKKSEGR